MPGVPEYIERRLRASVPGDSCVVPGSIPVIAFGDFLSAQVATLGLNPSSQEFQDVYGRELTGADRRFETLSSLGVTSLTDASPEVVQRAYEGCRRYFHRRPYRFWFDQLEQVVTGIGASFYSGSACHLDLVQWATHPKWRDLPKPVRLRLLGQNVPFMLEQIRRSAIRVLLLNGKTVVQAFTEASGVRLQQVELLSGPAHAPSRFYQGRVNEKTLAIGWSFNIQSSRGVTSELRAELTDRVRRVAEAEGFVGKTHSGESI